jgi:hypothetical protein
MMVVFFRRQATATKKCSICALPMVLVGEAFMCPHCDSVDVAPHAPEGCTICRKHGPVDSYDGVGPKLTQEQIAVVRASRGRGGNRT